MKLFGKPLLIEAQGSFAAGGTVIREKGTYEEAHALSPEGQEKHVDHGYVFYQIPADARKNALLFLHGAGQSGACWETTPDGREGFQTLFLRKGYKVYIMDQPRRGRAGSGGVEGKVTLAADEALWFDIFRFGHYPHYFENVQIPRGEEAENQFWRKVTPNTGAFDPKLTATALADTAGRAGNTILVTHSQGGSPGWLAAMKSANIKAIIALEPGVGFVFPEGEVPPPMESSSPFGPLKGVAVSRNDFEKLTQIPILMIFGDHIPENPSPHGGEDNWRVRLKEARLMAETINRYGGDAEVLHLPDIGVYGNTHFLFEDKNNEKIADIIDRWIVKKGLGE